MSEKKRRGLTKFRNEETIRKRPAPTFGTNDEKGAFQGVMELITNSVDEAIEGEGDRIIVDVKEGDIITVQDFGRGLPMDWNEEEQEYDWVLALCTLYATGKDDTSQYTQSTGLNGLGLTATQFASSFMDVWSTYDGTTKYMHFEKGRPVGELKVTPAEGPRGTKITYQPDREVFPALTIRNLSADMFLTALCKQAMLCRGTQIELTHYELPKAVKFLYKEGAKSYIDNMLEKGMLPETQVYTDKDFGQDYPELESEEYELDMEMTFNFSRDNSLVEIYHNTSHMFEGGESVNGFQRGITQAFNDFAKANGKIGKSEKFLYKDIAEILVCVGRTSCPGYLTEFKNQTKGAINNVFIGRAFAQFTYNKFRYWLETSGQLGQKVLTEVIANKTAREDAAEVSKKVINKLTKGVGFGNKPKGFRDCKSKNVEEREIYIVEGESALTSSKLACNPLFQAVMCIRGKMVNCKKAKLVKAIKNDIILDVYRVLGCGIEARSEYLEDLPKFDINKLRWNKIIICTDADVDGSHIRALLLTMFYVLTPSLLKQGKVFIVETPLYEISYKGKTKFAYNDKEKEEIVQDFISSGAIESKIKIQRSKGLGENDADMMSQTTMKPETRRLIKVEYNEEDEAAIREYFNALLGDDIEMRKVLVDEYFALTQDSE